MAEQGTPSSFYALRYLAGVPLDLRRHDHAVGRWESWLEAEIARESNPAQDLLEVVARGGEQQ